MPKARAWTCPEYCETTFPVMRQMTANEPASKEMIRIHSSVSLRDSFAIQALYFIQHVPNYMAGFCRRCVCLVLAKNINITKHIMLYKVKKKK